MLIHLFSLTGLITTTSRKLDREQQMEHMLEVRNCLLVCVFVLGKKNNPKNFQGLCDFFNVVLKKPRNRVNRSCRQPCSGPVKLQCVIYRLI